LSLETQATIQLNPRNVDCRSLVLKMTFSSFILLLIAGDKFLDNGLEGGGRQLRVGDGHGDSIGVDHGRGPARPPLAASGALCPAYAAMNQFASPPAASLLRRVVQLFRFRLLTLFVALSVIAGWLAWKFHREPISPQNVNQVRELSEFACPDIFKLVYSPDRHRVAFVAWEKPVDVRESITLWPVRTVGINRKLIQFAFSPDQRRVAFCENSTRAEIHNLDEGQHIVLETEAPQPHVVFSPDGKYLATGGYASEAKLWDAETGKLIHRFDCGPDIGGLTPAFSPDGRTVAVGNRNSQTFIFDVDSGKRLIGLPKRSTHELAFHPSGGSLAVAYADGSIGLWETATGKLITEQHKVAEEIYSLDWSPDGKLLASSGRKGDICLWDERLQLQHTLSASEWVISVKFSPDGTRLITAGGTQKVGGPRTVTVWGVPPAASWILTR
jgi:WD40 repeat protein